MSRAHIPDGVWPVMLTPFNRDRSIDWGGVDALTEWYLGAGVAGLFAVSQSSEMYALDDRERLRLAERVVKTANGRVPVIASGTFGGDIAGQAAFVRRVAETGVQAVVAITSVLAAEGEGDDAWCASAGRLLDLTGEVPLGLYECPLPYKRTLSPAVLAWAAATGRFVFHKDTCLEIGRIRAKIAATAGTPLRFFNAEMSSLSDSLAAGGHGFSGIAANLYPELLVWLCANWSAPAARRLQLLLSVAEMTAEHKYPASAKLFLGETRRVAISPACRVDVSPLTEHDRRAVAHLAEYLQGLELPGADASGGAERRRWPSL